jgi:hypothetical protein
VVVVSASSANTPAAGAVPTPHTPGQLQLEGGSSSGGVIQPPSGLVMLKETMKSAERSSKRLVKGLQALHGVVVSLSSQHAANNSSSSGGGGGGSRDSHAVVTSSSSSQHLSATAQQQQERQQTLTTAHVLTADRLPGLGLGAAGVTEHLTEGGKTSDDSDTQSLEQALGLCSRLLGQYKDSSPGSSSGSGPPQLVAAVKESRRGQSRHRPAALRVVLPGAAATGLHGASSPDGGLKGLRPQHRKQQQQQPRPPAPPAQQQQHQQQGVGSNAAGAKGPQAADAAAGGWGHNRRSPAAGAAADHVKAGDGRATMQEQQAGPQAQDTDRRLQRAVLLQQLKQLISK